MAYIYRHTVLLARGKKRVSTRRTSASTRWLWSVHRCQAAALVFAWAILPRGTAHGSFESGIEGALGFVAERRGDCSDGPARVGEPVADEQHAPTDQVVDGGKADLTLEPHSEGCPGHFHVTSKLRQRPWPGRFGMYGRDRRADLKCNRMYRSSPHLDTVRRRPAPVSSQSQSWLESQLDVKEPADYWLSGFPCCKPR
jgi:hypothetical protein